ncbi:MAG TPA: redoxin domain-containing protein [Bacteroidales bacterium]|nr:redoxin domain-containing protein [Bacteroidales bacterium]HRS18781.1 redoxin domain-containing protein [Bacteroidales bacterium]
MKFFSFVLFTFFSFLYSFSQDTTTIFACDREYANMHIDVYKYSDYFTKIEEKVGSFNVDSLGCFTFSFPNNTTQEIFMYLGIYKVFLFAEPGMTYELAMPPFEEKTLAEELNPYFVPQDLSFGVKNNLDPHEINMLILSFNAIYESFVSMNFQYIYSLRDKRIVDVLEQQIDSAFDAHEVDTFFNAYKNYQIYNLRFMAYQRDRMAMTRRHYLNKPFYYYNPAYVNFFQNMWKNYINNNHMKDMGKDIKVAIIYGKSPTMFKEAMEKYIPFRNDTLKELFLLQCLDDCFKDPDIFPRAPVIQTLDSLILMTKVPEHALIAQNIKKKRTVLAQGDLAPDFVLYNQDSVAYSLSQFAGKYVYLNFCRSENYACIQDYKVMQKMNEKTKRELQIVTLCYEKDFETFRNFKRKNPQYKWIFLYAGDHPEIKDYYKFKATPSYMLIDKQGKIELQNAPSPIDNFQEKFAQILIAKRKEELELKRKQRLYQTW